MGIVACLLKRYRAIFFTFWSFASGEDAFCFRFPAGELTVSLSFCLALKTEWRFGVVKSRCTGPPLFVLLMFLDLKIRVCGCEKFSFVLC